MVLKCYAFVLVNKLRWNATKSEGILHEFTVLKYIPTYNPEFEMMKMMRFKITLTN
jgi:hypothetical protein